MNITRLFGDHPPREPLTSLEAIVRDWNWRFGPNGVMQMKRDKVVDYCAEAPNIVTAVRRAIDSRDADGKMHNHQTRISKRSKIAAKRIMARDRVWHFLLSEGEPPPSFESFFYAYETNLYNVKGIGPVSIYDYAVRTAAWAKRSPHNYLYLHAGVREGLSSLFGRKIYAKRVLRRTLPAALQTISTDEIEDLICTYRSILNPALLEASDVGPERMDNFDDKDHHAIE